jgi:hypothetical protein
MFAEIERDLTVPADADSALQLITRLAVAQVPGTQEAGITRGRDGAFTSAAETSDMVTAVDAIQYELRSGPCVDAVMEGTAYCTGDLRTDERWPQFGRRAFEAAGVLSMLSFRLYLEDDPGMIAGLNMYSTQESAFNKESETIGLMLATHGALALSGALARQRAHYLELALANSREIGIAIGVLRTLHKITRDQAFDLLRLASQGLHRKLASIAADVADTGSLPAVPPVRRG